MSKSNVEVTSLSKAQGGNALIIVLVILILAAVGVLAYMSGKMGVTPANTDSETQTASADAPQGDSPNADPVIAKVNGEEIKRSEVQALVNMMPPQMQQIPLEQILPIAIEQLVNNKVIDAQSKGASLDSDPEVVKQMAMAKEQIVRGRFLEKAMDAKMTEDILKAKYDQYVKDFPDVQEVKAAHILVETEDKAKEIIKELEAGKSFAELAKANSKDGTAQNGGDLGYFTQQDVVPEFAKAAFDTKVGEYTKKPVKTQFGFHIIKVEDKRKRPPASFEEAKGFIEQEARREILETLIKDWKAAAKIERFDINGNPLPPQGQEPAAGGAPAPAAPAAEKPAE